MSSRCTVAVIAIVIGSIVAAGCWEVSVEGDRASSGFCPVASCSSATPNGLVFVGAGFWDNADPHLGPIVAGGTFDLGLREPGGSALPPMRVEVDDAAVLTAELGVGRFVASTYDAEDGGDYLVVHAGHAGSTRLRVVHARTGELLDQITLAVDEVGAVVLRNVEDPERPHLVAGRTEVLGLRLLIDARDGEFRAVDQGLELHASGTIQPELMYWDCFSFETPHGVSSVTFDAIVGGRSYPFVIPVE